MSIWSVAELFVRRDSLSIEDILSAIQFSERLPISLPVLSLLLPNVANVEETLRSMGCTLLSLGDRLFLTAIPSKCLRFTPSLVTPEQIRDAVVDIQSYRPWNPDPVEQGPMTACKHILEDRCGDTACTKQHFKPVIREGITDENAGLCSYLDLCKNETCKFVHVQPSIPVVSSEGFDASLSSTIKCDIRTFPLGQVLYPSGVGAILIDPPWDIHMELSYGTLTDDEMRNLDVGSIHESGFVFLWATTRTLEVARDCLRLWGYVRTTDIVWVKVNQVGGTVRSGRTGHWLNHCKEHCLVGLKGDISWSNSLEQLDCDVIVAPVRENSRKPDEIYGIIERLVGPDRMCVELFGRNHNRRNGWVTVGNQLDETYIAPFHKALIG
jgi:N6-adenosine-specific RNA methylase IME4